MKILLLADRMEAGGAETHVETLALGFLRAGHTVGLCSCGGKIADRMAAAGVRCRTLPKIGRNPFAFLAAKRILAEEIAKNGYEVLHAHTRMTALLLRRICNPYMRKTPKMPVRIVTIHARFRANWLLRLLSDWGERTIAVSEDLRAHLAAAFRLPAERVTVIPNGIDTALFAPPAEKPRAPIEILFVSRLEPDCSLGAELLLQAACSLAGGDFPPFRVTIVGQGSRFSALAVLAGKVNLLFGRQLVRVIRPRGRKDLIAQYRAAAIFVGVSRAAMEASFCGAAVLLCGNEGYGGLLSPDRRDLAAGNFCCRGLPPPTLAALTRDLAILLRNPHRCRANAEKTGAWMRRLFSADRMCRATARLYRACLALRARPPEKMPRLCIGGYAGCGNLGDDAVLSGILRGLFRRGVSPASVVVLSGDPRLDRRRFGVRCVGRKNPFAILFALLRADWFLLGGGTLLQTRTGRRSLLYYLFLLRLARLCGCRTVLSGGLDELSERDARRVRRELEHCAALLLRDDSSFAVARDRGLKNPRLSVGADPAFLLPLPPFLRAAFLQDRLVGGLKKPFVCVCPCGGVSVSGISAFLRRSLFGFFPVYLLCDEKRDRAPAELLRRSFGGVLFVPREASEALALFRAARLTLSCRLHPLILSVRAGARCVCFSGGDPKLSAFCLRAGIPLFPAQAGCEIPPPAATLLALARPDPAEFCALAAKDLAILSEMVYNRREEALSAQRPKSGRTFHEKRATGGSAPPHHH